VPRDATAGTPARVKHHAPPPGSLRHRARRDARQHLEHRHRITQDGDERWECISKSALAQKRMQERLGFYVWVWPVIMRFFLGWETPKVEVVRTTCQ
jgi:hypothetical protein